MLKEKMQEALCEQINAELSSSYLYLSMVAYFESESLSGFAHWLRMQAHEELLHVMKMFDYVHTRNGRVRLRAVAAPLAEWDSPLAAFQHVYAHECEVTEQINKLIDLTIELSDHATRNMLLWFAGEQVEEESNADAIVQQLKLVAGSGHGLLLLDRELATRPQPTLAAPAAP